MYMYVSYKTYKVMIVKFSIVRLWHSTFDLVTICCVIIYLFSPGADVITVWEVASAFVERQMVQQKVLPAEGAECDMEHPLCDLHGCQHVCT